MNDYETFIRTEYSPADYEFIMAKARAERARVIAGHFSALSKFLKKAAAEIFKPLTLARKRAQVRQELYSLDRRQLDDMGINHGDIMRIAAESNNESTIYSETATVIRQSWEHWLETRSIRRDEACC